MLRIITIFVLLIMCSSTIAADELKKTHANKIKYVIYITFDGTRWQDIFLDHSYLKTFWEKYADKVNLYGMPNTNTTMSVASIPVSLPSYQSQMSGALQPCLSNDCGRITVQTLPEILKEKLGLEKKDVAVFGSWYEIAYAAEHIYGSVFTNTGNYPVYDPNTQTSDPMMHELNIQQINDNSYGKARLDKYTYAQAMHYFETYRPRFLWIALNDSDSAAHDGDLNRYHEAIQFYDHVLDETFTKLKTMQIENETMLLVTTDHGRGNGKHWTSHGARLRASKQTWAFLMNGNLKPISESKGIINYSTLSVRPTIEEALGVS